MKSDAEMLAFCTNGLKQWQWQRWCSAAIAMVILLLIMIEQLWWHPSTSHGMTACRVVAWVLISIQVVVGLRVQWRGDPLYAYIVKRYGHAAAQPDADRAEQRAGFLSKWVAGMRTPITNDHEMREYCSTQQFIWICTRCLLVCLPVLLLACAMLITMAWLPDLADVRACCSVGVCLLAAGCLALWLRRNWRGHPLYLYILEQHGGKA